jgi:hypothetical protein
LLRLGCTETIRVRTAMDGYIDGAEEHRRAVTSLNMFAASLAVYEFLARIHPFRHIQPSEHGDNFGI